MVFFRCFRLNAINRAKRDTDLTSGAVVFIYDSHQFWFLLFVSRLFREFGDRFVMIVDFGHGVKQ